MKRTLLLLSILLTGALIANAQNIDTIAIQDFEGIPATPTWTYTGTLADVQSGYASATACIPNTPLGIDGSAAWHVVSVSGGNPIIFDNQTIPQIYDSIFMSFRLQGLNLNGATGGPDDLDYVLVEYSLDGGATFVARVRVRGAVNNNSFWPYDATGQGVVDYLPATETVFQPINSGLQMTEGIAYVEIGFPGSITQLEARITPRSSSSTDSWLVDNVLLTGKNSCVNSTNSITETTCETYLSPAGNVYDATGIYTDVIPNAAGCDSIITIDLTVNAPDISVTSNDPSLTANATGATYQWLDCDNSYAQIGGETGQSFTASMNGNYAVEVTSNGCTDTSACYPIASTGISEGVLSDVVIAPNPTTNELHVQWGDQSELLVEVLDLNGKLIERHVAIQKININTSAWDAGVYMVIIKNGEDTLRKKVVKK